MELEMAELKSVLRNLLERVENGYSSRSTATYIEYDTQLKRCIVNTVISTVHYVIERYIIPNILV